MSKVCEQCGGTGQLETGVEMRAKRLALGVSGADVARAMNVSRAYIHVLETGYGPHPPRWTADVTRRYEAALEGAQAARLALEDGREDGSRSDGPGGVQSTTTR